MVNPLIPHLEGRLLTVDVVLRQPTILRDRIAHLADSQLLMPKFFTSLGAPVEGGGILYSVAKASDLYASGVEKRSPGAEYAVVDGVQPEPKRAVVEDWGGRFQILDEHKDRNDVSYVDNQTTQLANSVVAKVDAAAMAAVIEADVDDLVVSAPWDTAILDGATPTDPSERPTGSLAQALEAFEVDELGIVPDTLITSPAEARVLRTLYGKDLADVLESFGLELVSNARLAAGSAYVVQAGELGAVGFEKPLTVEIYDERATRSHWCQTYTVPAFAVEKPYAAKRLTALATP